MYDYTIYNGEDWPDNDYITIYCKEKISKEEFVEIVETTMKQICEDDDYIDIDEIADQIIKNDKRFTDTISDPGYSVSLNLTYKEGEKNAY